MNTQLDKNAVRVEDIGQYEVYRTKYINCDGKNSVEYAAYKKGTGYSEVYRIARASLRSLRKEIEQN